MKNSVLYFLLEGFSRGGIQFFLLFISYYFGENIYITLMLLVSLETLIPLFFPTNYIDALSPLLKTYSSQKITSNFFILNFIFLLLFCLLFLIFMHALKKYYNYHNGCVYFLILLNVFLVRWLYFSAYMKQMQEKHSVAIKIKGIPFILSMIFAAFMVFMLDDKILGFFIGKTFGILIYCLYIVKQENMDLVWDKNFIKDFIGRSKYLLLTGLLGWATGYGFLNVAHTFYTELDTKNFAYMLNVYMIFLMVIFGGMQVLRPKILKLVDNSASFTQLKSFYLKTMFVYTSVGVGGVLFFLLLQTINLPENIARIIDNGDLAILLFILVAAESTARLIIYSKDDIKKFTYNMVSIELIGWLIVAILLFFFKVKMFYIYFVLIFIRSLYVVEYAYKRENI